MHNLGICVTFNPLFKHMFQIDDIAYDFKKIAGIGYKGIELSIRDIGDVGWEDFDYHLKKNNLELVTIATGLIRVADKVSLIDDEKKDRDLAISKLVKMIDHISGYPGCSKNILIGFLKGTVSNIKSIYNKQVNTLKNSLVELLKVAENKKVTLVLEIINHGDSNFLYTIESGVDFISKFKSDYLKLAIDTYHMSIDEADITDSIEKAGSNIGYVHLSDDNRGYPGLGGIDFSEIINTLKMIDYTGYLTLEYNSGASKYLSLEKGFKNIQRYLQ